MKLKKFAVGTLASGAALMLAAGPALAHECTNASKNQHNPGAGAKLIFDCNDEGLIGGQKNAIKLLESGGFPHGWIAFDIDCDGIPDAGTYIVGPNGELPATAQENGSTTHGIMNICDYFGLPPGCTD
jgi:hypothetical protein